jgi:hypothetical protein
MAISAGGDTFTRDPQKRAVSPAPNTYPSCTLTGIVTERGKVIHHSAHRSTQCSAVETEVYVVCAAPMEIRTEIDLKRTQLAMDHNLRGEITESTPVADVVWMRHEPTSEKIKLNGNGLP